MKLNSKTRERVKFGTHLVSNTMELVVTNMLELKNGKQITVKFVKHPDAWTIGRQIYMQPLSNYYGMEIKENE